MKLLLRFHFDWTELRNMEPSVDWALRNGLLDENEAINAMANTLLESTRIEVQNA